MPRSAKSLSTRPIVALIAVATLLVCALLWAAVIAQVQRERAHVEKGALQANRNRAIAYEQYVTRTLEAADFAAIHLATHFGPQLEAPAAGAAPRLIRDPVAANPLLAGVVIADARGDVRWTSFPDAAPLNLRAREVFGALAKGAAAGLIISKPRFSTMVGQPVIAMTRRIDRPDGSFGGTVTVQLAVERLTEFSEGAALRRLDLISVIRPDGITLARRTGGEVSFGEDVRERLVMKRQRADPNGTYRGPSSLDGIERYFSHRRLAAYPAFVTVGVGVEDVHGEARRRSTLYFASAAGLTVALLLAAWLAIVGLLRRDKATLAMAESNRRLREAQRIGRIGDWEYEPAAGRIVWSDQLCEMYGRDPVDDVLARDEFFAYFDEESRARLGEAFDEVLVSGAGQQCDVAVIKGAHGSTRRLQLAARIDSHGLPVAIVGTDQDVTDEMLHAQLREDAAHLSRIDAMNIMAVTIAHEIAQPLTAAANYLSGAKIYARRRNQDDWEMIGDALVQAEQQIGLTRDIMRRARDMLARRSARAQHAAVRDVVEDAVALVRMANDCGHVDIVQRLAPEAVAMAADKVQMQQVLMNLIRNASEAAGAAEKPRVVVTSSRIRDGSILVCVEDNGPGIPTELADIFSPFASSKSRGLGLGLAISRAIVQSVRGRIWISRSSEGGAAICLTIPAAEAA